MLRQSPRTKVNAVVLSTTTLIPGGAVQIGKIP
jgi:hypothetical protein